MSAPRFLSRTRQTAVSRPLAIVLLFMMAILDVVDALIRQHKWNQELVRGLNGDYEVVYPFQLRDRVRIGIDTRNYFYSNGTIHHQQVTFVVRSSFGRFRLILERNNQLIVPGAVYKQVLEGGRSHNADGLPENCYYQGTLHNDPDSAVAVSSCVGLRAVIFSQNDTFSLIPLRGGDMGKRHPHLLFKSRFERKVGCANDDHSDWSSSLSRKHTTGRRYTRDVQRSEKYLELAIVADYGLAKQLAFQFEPMLHFILESTNVLDLMYQRHLNTRVSLVYLEVWTEQNIITLAGDITQTLLNFIDYVSTELYDEKKDATLFLTSHDFARREASMATSGSVCTARAAGVVQSDDQFQPHQTAVVMAHNLGHLIGMKHDRLEDGRSACNCADSRGCLMRHMIGGKRYEITPSFSTCSLEDLLLTLKLGQGRCLFNKPMQKDTLEMCGNKIIDPGEECDCGSIEECDLVDRCCDPVTCKLKSFAQCASGPCCDSCKLKPSGHLCRASKGECDVPETCDGKIGRCPSNAVKVNGAVCGEGKLRGICYKGRCASVNRQCTQIWGQGALSAHSECYERFNVLGVEHGHCGRDESSGLLRQCDLHNVGCGLLHCHKGEKAPLDQKLERHMLNMQFVETGVEHECKVIYNSTVGLVMEGTECGVDGVCLSGACVPKRDIFPVTKCPTNNLALQCSGHGVCTTADKCFCKSGWSGLDCGEQVLSQQPVLFSTMAPNLTNPFAADTRNRNRQDYTISRINTSTMLFILGGVAAAIVILLLFLLLCYRRRTASDLRKKKIADAARSEFERFSESSADTAQRSIKFGSMPSYRDEKRQRKKKRFIHDLSRINEASDEKDSVSNRSRDSGASRRAPSPDHFATASAPPDRGILKNGGCNAEYPSDGEVFSPLLPAPAHLGGISSGDAGYESEPAVYSAYRVFEKSMRQLDEYNSTYNPYHVPVTSATPTGHYRTSPSKSDYCPSAHFRQSPRPGHPLVLFSPQTQRAPHRPVRSGYATDTELSHTPRSARRRPSVGENPSTPPHNAHLSVPAHSTEPLTDRTSPTGSVASSRGLGRPQPLKLRNIEFLLKQLDNATTSLSPTSSGEFSAPEAEKACDESSNTESHRDANHMADVMLGREPHCSTSPPEREDCLVESYEALTVTYDQDRQTCNSQHESRPKDLHLVHSTSYSANARHVQEDF